MGVAPYSWPHAREWQPGIHDKRSNLGMWFVLIVYLLFFIGFTSFIGLDLLLGDYLVALTFMVTVLAGIVALFLVGQTARRDIKVEDLKYFEVRPERLSELLKGVLDMDRVKYLRDGPHQAREDYWKDTFKLVGDPWEGITLVVERNPLIARVDTASVTVRGTSRSTVQFDKVKEKVDGAVMRELIDRYGLEKRTERPDLVVYGRDRGDPAPDPERRY